VSRGRGMSWACVECGGRGWRAPAASDGWAEPCGLCNGQKRLGPTQLASLLAIGTRTKVGVTTMRHYIWLVETGRAHHAAGMHVLRAISKRFPEVLCG
jgi:hypothetical protein